MRFRVVELCHGLAADQTHANAINRQGDVLIRQFQGVYVIALLWRKGKREALKIPGISCFASSLNDHGQVVGSFGEDRDDQTGFLWSNGKVTVLPTLGNKVTLVSGVNNAGLIVGLAYVAGVAHPVLWKNRKIEDISKRIGVPDGSLFSVNDAGTLLGNAGRGSDDQRPFLYHQNTLSYLPVDASAMARSLNQLGWVAGSVWDKRTRNSEAFLFRDKKLVRLGRLGGVESEALGLNDFGVVVGEYVTKRGMKRAFIWADQKMRDLTAMIDRKDMVITAARAINRQGYIVGTADVKGKETACLLVPQA